MAAQAPTAALTQRVVGLSRATWGYVWWGIVGGVIGIPEIVAAVRGKENRWPTISGTIGHLELIWDWTAIIVVAGVAAAATHIAVRRPDEPEREVARGRGRTAGGRLTKDPVNPESLDTFGVIYVALSVFAVLVPSALVGFLVDDDGDESRWVLGYVIYGLIAVFFVLLPSLLVFVAERDMPFPTLFYTFARLRQVAPWVLLIVFAGLAVLLIHLALYPWPDIADILNPKPPAPTSR